MGRFPNCARKIFTIEDYTYQAGIDRPRPSFISFDDRIINKQRNTIDLFSSQSPDLLSYLQLNHQLIQRHTLFLPDLIFGLNISTTIICLSSPTSAVI